MFFLKGADLETYQPTSSCSWILKGILKFRAYVFPTVAWVDTLRTRVYKTSLIYRALRGEKVVVSWRTMLYNNLARPRSLFVLWLSCWGRLFKKDRLARFGISTDGLCCFCGDAESVDHLFFYCAFTRQIWNQILNWIGIHHISAIWNLESVWLSRECAKKGWRRKVLKIAVAENPLSG